jgi:hypothetical protein
MNIVYYLLTHKNEQQIRRLVTHLQSSENSFVLIHHDAKSTPLEMPPSDKLVVMDDPVEVRWGHISQVHARHPWSMRGASGNDRSAGFGQTATICACSRRILRAPRPG